METLFGNVVNYDIKVREDGGFDCSIDIVSKNMALLSHNLPERFKAAMDDRLDIAIITYAASAFEGTAAEYLMKTATEYTEHSDLEEMKFLYYKWGAENLGGISEWQIPGEAEEKGSALASQIGVYFGGADTNNLELYVCYGWIEDNIFNKEFGFGDTPDELTGEVTMGSLHARYDSSNSYITYSSELHLAHKNRTKEDGNLTFLYPANWDVDLGQDGGEFTTYNWNRGMVPNYEYKGGRTNPDSYLHPTNKTYKWNPNTKEMKVIDNEGDMGRGVCPLREIFISVDLIKEALKNGEEVPGCELVQENRITIK